MKNKDYDPKSTPAAGNPKLILGYFPENLEEALVGEISRIKSSDPLAGAVIVVSSQTAAGYLEWGLARRGVNLGNVRMITLDRLARSLEAPNKKTPLAARNEAALIQAALKKALGEGNPFGAAVEYPGFSRLIDGSIKDLSEAGIAEIPAAVYAAMKPKTTGRLQTVAKTLKWYREQFLPPFHTDIEKYAPISSPDILKDSVVNDCELLFFGLFDFNEIQFNFISSLARISSTTFLIPCPSRNNRPVPAYAFASRTIDRLTAEFPSGSTTFLPTTQAFIGSLFDYENIDSCSGSPLEADLKIFSAIDPASECQLIAGLAADLVFNKHVLPSSIGIVLWQSEVYRPMMIQALRRAATPVYDGIGTKLGKSETGKALIELLSIASEGVGGNQLCELIQNQAVKKPDVDEEGALVLIEEIVNKCGIVKAGLTVWENRLDFLIQRAPVDQFESRMHDAVGKLRSYIVKLFSRIEQIRSEVTFSAKIEWTLLLVDEFLIDGVERAELKASLGGFKSLDSATGELIADKFPALLASCLDSVVLGKGTPVLDGVAILSPMNARAVKFDYIFLPGMTQGSIPAVTRENPLLTDEIRGRINRAYSGRVDFPLALSAGRAAEEKLLFGLIAGSARKNLTLSFPVRSLADGRISFPSHFLLELCRIVTGSSIASDELEKLPFYCDWTEGDNSSGWEERLVQTRDFPARLLRLTPAAQRLKLLKKLLESGVDELEFINRNGDLRGSGNRWNLFEGMPGRSGSDAEIIKLAVTDLEEYARCPFRCWMLRKLRLAPWQDPDVVLDIPPEILGQALHRIYEKLFGLAKTTGRIPLTDNDLQWACDQIPIILEHYRPRLRFDCPAPPGVWAISEKMIIERVTNSIPFLISTQGDYKFTESEFAIEQEVEIFVGGKPTKILLTGRIDRFDMSDDGRGCHVIDYKSGSVDDPDDVNYGTRLQLPLYLNFLMEKELRLEPNRCKASYFKIAHDGNLDVYSVDGEWVKENQDALKLHMGTIAEGIIEGIFPPIPIKTDICRNCPVEKACDRKSRSSAEYRRDDERLERFLALRGGV